MSLDNLSGLLTSGIFVLAPLLAAVLVGMLTAGRVRVLGVIGFGILTIEGVLNLIWLLVVPQVSRSDILPLSVLAGVYSAIRAVLGLAAIATLAFAVVLDRRRPRPPGSVSAAGQHGAAW